MIAVRRLTRRPALWTVGVLIVVGALAATAVTLGTLIAPSPVDAPRPAPVPTSQETLHPQPGPISGRWVASDGSQAGFRIAEVPPGGVAGTPPTPGPSRTGNAGARPTSADTTRVQGSAHVQHTRLVAGEFTIQLRDLRSGDQQLDARLRERADAATLTISEPTELPDLAQAGHAQVNLPTEITIDGRANRVSVDSRLVRTGNGIAVSGSADLAWADYDVHLPGALGAAQRGQLEFSVRLRQAS